MVPSKAAKHAGARTAPSPCYHGGEFFTAVGEEFDTLERLHSVISADVLDAWFPPSPKAVAALRAFLPDILRTSPPTQCGGQVRAIARARGIKPECILPGAGSSDLIFRAFLHWLKPASRALILDPTYGEYPHVLEKVIGCRVDRLILSRADNYQISPRRLVRSLSRDCDIAIIVNPNNPTGQHLRREDLERVLRIVPVSTRIWIDETYVDYVGPGQSLEDLAAASQNIIVCKSLSKTLALSGARVGYLCASPAQLAPLRALTPPWVVSLPAQVAAVRALEDAGYYAAKYRETRALRQQLAQSLQRLGWDVIPSEINSLLCHLPSDGPDAATLVAKCRDLGLFLRPVAVKDSKLGARIIRIAVKDAATNRRMVNVLRSVAFGLKANSNSPA